MREGLLRFACNDNVPYIIKGIASVIAMGLSEAISRFSQRRIGCGLAADGISSFFVAL
ncbi:MAG: hypothetical protein IT420_14160 [Candidatus Brocadia sp.]|nr:hypothetical protein [Candidatus Brocadia sp.]